MFATGCATLPSSFPDGAGEEAVAGAIDDWALTPALVSERLGTPLVVTAPEALPRRFAEQYIELSLNRGSTLADFTYSLGLMGIPTMVNDNALADRGVWVPHYAGSVGKLLDAISSSLDIAFTWRDGILSIEERSRYVVKVPQEAEIMSAVASELASLGAHNIVTSRGSGTVAFQVNKGDEAMVLDYLKRVAGNAATVSLQVAVVSVQLNRETRRGFDWSAMGASYTRGGPVNFGGGNGGNGGNTPGAEIGDGTGEILALAANTTAESAGAAASTLGAKLSGSGIELLVRGGEFSLNGLLSTLSTYGNAQTTQNLVLKTLSGSPVRIRSGNEVPYVDNVGVTSNENTSLGSASTKTAREGLTIEMTPIYDAETGLVTIDMDMELNSILAFVELQAGNQIGTLTQPNIQEQSFNDIAQIRAGETVVVGGIAYDQVSDNRNTLGGLERLPLGHRADRVERRALFIVVRPTVRQYEFD
ncbi:type II secretion system protein GspD [Natronocella acetinitrilica]|uniref:type II secretion system protein GspD n=1 Tax=Natronocella acetinitrilica TaxID=414046 RepID=UPI0020A22BD9|nr:type II and III secretion system protein [Natronocella acetinitrilica]